ncbi:MAG TPA: HWE histidine kinase domain-containing protein [Xanthobacteraceae bacterium]
MASDEPNAEIADLRQRLAEAEEALRAIYQGEVDALVVRGPDGPQVFTLRGAQEPYRILVEHMHEGALTVSDAGLILYCNHHFATLVGRPLEQIVGRPIAQFVARQDAQSLQGLLGSGAGGSIRRELALQARNGVIPTLAAASPMQVDGEATAILLIVTDLTAQKQSEKIAAAEQFARSILEQATDVVLVCRSSGSISNASWAAERLFGHQVVGQLAQHALPLQFGASDQGPSPEAIWKEILAGKRIRGLEAFIGRGGQPPQNFLVSAGPLHDDTSGERIGFILTLTDITERKRAEEHQTMLVAELNHRVKNILAVVQSVASQTVASSPSLDQFRTAFEGRVRAISLAHDILTQLRWSEVELEHIVGRSLAPYRGGDRVAWTGPPVRLAASSVVSLAMVLHELSTNAAKYGAFANGEGRVEIAWRRLDADRGELTWTERGGPPLAGEPKPGFGNKLISRVIAYDLQGSATMRFEPDGLRCRLTFRIPSTVNREAAEGPVALASGR